MAKDNKNINKKPKVNPYWIYGIIIAAFLGIQLFSGGFGGSTSKKINPSEFFEYLDKGDVSKLVIVNRQEARVYLTKEALQQETHKKSKPNNLLPSVTPQPNYTFEFGELELFQQKIEDITNSNSNINVPVSFVTEENHLGNFIFSLLPFILIIAVWIFIMRRMSGGSGGGAGGQIFNIGKSKAKLFDEKTDVKTQKNTHH